MGVSKKQEVESKVAYLLEKILCQTEYEVVEVEFVEERGNFFLRIFLDKEDGFCLDDCQWVSERLGKVLEEEDCIDVAYNLEVSSPGIDRALKSNKDFERYKGKLVEVHLFAPEEGQKKIIGKLKGLRENLIVIEKENLEKTFERKKVSLVKLYVEF